VAEDIGHYLANRPIMARGPGGAYLLRKMIARNKALVVLSATFVVLLIVFAVWMTVLYRNAEAQRRRARLAEVDASREAGWNTRAALDDGADPSIRHILALAQHANGAAGEAIGSLREAPARPRRLSARSASERDLARMLEDTGDAEGDIAVFADTLALRRQRFPSLHPDIAQSLEDRATILLRHGQTVAAEAAARECLAIRGTVLPEDDWRTGQAMAVLGAVLSDRGRLAEANRLLTDAVALLERSPSTPRPCPDKARRLLHEGRKRVKTDAPDLRDRPLRGSRTRTFVLPKPASEP